MKVKLVKLIYEAVQNQIPEEKILIKVRDIINDIPNFNIREKAQMYILVKKIATLMYMQEGKLYNKHRTSRVCRRSSPRRCVRWIRPATGPPAST